MFADQVRFEIQEHIVLTSGRNSKTFDFDKECYDDFDVKRYIKNFVEKYFIFGIPSAQTPPIEVPYGQESEAGKHYLTSERAPRSTHAEVR